MDDDTGGGGNVDIVNITFGEITGSSSQDHVTGTIKTSLERLQAQTQNIINKMTEYKEEQQQQLVGFVLDKEYNEIQAKIKAATNILDYENQIKTDQQFRLTETGFNNMDSHYGSVIGEIEGLLSGQTNQNLLGAKISTYRRAVNLDERNIISSVEKTAKLNALDSDRKHVVTLEYYNGNPTYTLPDPATNLSGLIGPLENEIKQTLSDENVLGQYGQYIFYQGQDIAQYFAILLDAVEIEREINLP
jgi:hypothetical protein